MSIPTVSLNDGHRIPQLGFGVWQVSTREIVPVVSTALRVGYRHIDTAAVYGNEEGVGQAIRESGIPREDLFLTTKLWNDRHGDARAALEESLDRLGLDYLDLYLIHFPGSGRGHRVQAWAAMQEAQADGLIRSTGVANFMPRHLDEILTTGGRTPAVNQIEYHPTAQQTQVEGINAEHGIATEAYSPLGLGEDLDHPAVAAIADRLGRTPAQVILRWHLQAGRIVIPKSVTPARIAENFAVTDFAITDGDSAALDRLDARNFLVANPDRL